jgi:hypothetical protein
VIISSSRRGGTKPINRVDTRSTNVVDKLSEMFEVS